MCTSRTSKPARLRFKPPGPRADNRRSCVSIDSGLVWSTTCDSSPRPKKYSIAAEMLLGLIRLRRRHVLDVLQAHPLLHGAAELEETLAQFVAGQFVDRPQAAIAQVIDVVDFDVRIAVPQLQQIAMAAIRSSGRSVISFSGMSELQLAVDAEAADLAQPVAVRVEELLVEQGPGLFQLRRVAGPQPLVDSQQGLFVAGRACLRPVLLKISGIFGSAMTSTDCQARGADQSRRCSW